MDRTRISTTLGLLAVGAVLVLHLPGVQVARASDASAAMSVDPSLLQSTMPPAKLADAGPAASSCGGGMSGIPSQGRVEDVMAKVKQRARIEMKKQGRDPEAYPAVTMLNGNGYNYGAGAQQGLDIGALRRDLKMAE